MLTASSTQTWCLSDVPNVVFLTPEVALDQGTQHCVTYHEYQNRTISPVLHDCTQRQSLHVWPHASEISTWLQSAKDEKTNLLPILTLYLNWKDASYQLHSVRVIQISKQAGVLINTMWQISLCWEKTLRYTETMFCPSVSSCVIYSWVKKWVFSILQRYSWKDAPFSVKV